MSDTRTEPSLEQVLIEKERRKWESFADTGRFAGEFLTEDFLSIGAMPGGGSRARHTDDRVVGTHQQRPEAVRVSDFRVQLLTTSSEARTADAAVVTYRLDAARPMYATSVWVRRDGRWQTALYQATPADHLGAG
jgi:hypothetical protein